MKVETFTVAIRGRRSALPAAFCLPANQRIVLCRCPERLNVE
jgi:hypothetical protein